MNNRYTNSDTLVTDKLIRKKSTLIYPTIPVNPQTDIYIKTTSIERLDKLALQFYGNAMWWWVIASANGLGKGSIVIPTDTNLRIPDITNINNLITTLNDNR